MKEKQLKSQLIKFAGVGVIGTAGQYATLILLVQLFDVQAVLSSGFGAIVGALINYHLNYNYTFSSSKRHSETIIKFFTVAGVSLALNTLIMYAMVFILKWHYLYAQFLTTLIVLIVNFSGNRLWTFREDKNQEERG